MHLNGMVLKALVRRWYLYEDLKQVKGRAPEIGGGNRRSPQTVLV